MTEVQPLDPRGVAVFFTVQGRPFIYNGNSGLFLDEIPSEVATALTAAGPHGPAAVASEGWGEWLEWYRAGKHPDLDPEARQSAFLQRGGPGRYVVCLAQACNLACTYCVNQGGSYGGPPRVMRLETARACAAFLQRQLLRDDCEGLSVVLFGGEPLLARSATRIVVEGLLEGRRRSGKPVRAVLCTNGTVDDPELFRVFAQNAPAFNVAISLDGGRENHDRLRPFSSGNGRSSWDTALATIRRLVDDGVRVSVTCVVAAPYEYVTRAEELHAIGVRRLEIKPVITHVYGATVEPDVLRPDFERWRERYLAYTDWCLERGGLLPPSDVVHNDRVVLLREYAERLDGSPPRRLGCSAADEGAAIDVEGRIFACDAFIPHPEMAIGDVRGGIEPQRLDAFAGLLLRDGQHRTDDPVCAACFAKRFCGGGCYAASFDRTGALKRMDDASCAFVREKVLLDLYFVSRIRAENPEGVAEVFRA